MFVISSFYVFFVVITWILAFTALFKVVGFNKTRWYHYLGIIAVSMVPLVGLILLVWSLVILVFIEVSSRKKFN